MRNTRNIRIKFSCWLISQAIKTVPKEWRTKNAIRNLISIESIKIEKPTDNHLEDMTQSD